MSLSHGQHVSVLATKPRILHVNLSTNIVQFNLQNQIETIQIYPQEFVDPMAGSDAARNEAIFSRLEAEFVQIP